MSVLGNDRQAANPAPSANAPAESPQRGLLPKVLTAAKRLRLTKAAPDPVLTEAPAEAQVEPEPPIELEEALRMRPIESADTCWIFGSGRSGSSWLLEMIAALPGVVTWYEPFFGKLLQSVYNAPKSLEDDKRFLSNAHIGCWAPALKDLFLRCANERYEGIPAGGNFVIKDVNAAALCPFFARIFPDAKYMLLVRDPFDVLDSHIDMQRPGSWNEAYGKNFSKDRLRHTAEDISKSMSASLAGYDSVSPELRLFIRYEDMLEDAARELARCTEFLRIELERQWIDEIAANTQFSKYEKKGETGRMSFHRFGKAGTWKLSGNFTPDVLAIAEETLGPLRDSLGYSGHEAP